MRLAFCLFKYYPFGGLERDFMKIALECQRRGHAIDVYTMAWEGEVPAGFSIKRIAAKGMTNHARCNSFAQQVTAIIAKNNYDLVVGFNRMPGLDVYFAADVCYAAQAQAKHSPWYRFTPRYRTYAKLEQAVFAPELHTEILLLVEPEKERYKQYYATPERRFHLVPAGIDKTQLLSPPVSQTRTEIRQSLGMGDDEILILMVGSDFKRKGVDRAIRAIAALPMTARQKVRLAVIGKGQTAPYTRLAQKLGIADRLIFLGARNNVGCYMAAADLLLHPAYQETAGMVLLEALVVGLPIVVTENCGYAFHAQRAQAGAVVSMPFAQQKLNQSLLSALNREQRKIWQQNALYYAENTDLYSLPIYAANLFETL